MITSDYRTENEISNENSSSDDEGMCDIVDSSGSLSDDNVEEVDEHVLTQKSFSDKLREWTINGNIKLTEISKLLRILVYDGNRHFSVLTRQVLL